MIKTSTKNSYVNAMMPNLSLGYSGFFRGLSLAILLVVAIFTPGFLSIPTLDVLVTQVSVIGCLAVGMTYITLSGNVMSFALAASAAASSVVFVHFLNEYNLSVALVTTLLFSSMIAAIQGWLIGAIRANPIIVSIAFNVLIYGVASWFLNNATAYVLDPAAIAPMKATYFGISLEFSIFFLSVLISQFVISFTVYGRRLLLIGSGVRAAESVGISVTKTTVLAYISSGIFAGVCGILLASRYDQGNMQFASNYDYGAIAAVLIGGTAVIGGSGSMFRTLFGVVITSVIDLLLLLNGFREEWRLTITGVLVLLVIFLNSNRREG